MLDLSLWVEDNNVRNSFYAKPMASPYAIKYASALSLKTKKSSFLQEGLRRLRNMGPGVPEDEKSEVMPRYMNSLKMRGYDHKYRL